ncbi:30S ribosome-binding factor RbfA [Desulfosarcina sp. OttesenSCG-928-G10]|nr:30S ribosome-binding factor RbfA [Desulfosarcina sp. OttesenSCG-928-G10]MDL2322207.1 30S ribosome-binding factor RbfA [Desulfosarcina sp. OttesenSCG-928-B08]
MAQRTFDRAQRVGGQIQRVMAELLRQGISDPRLSTVTITGVTTTRDLRLARIYFAAPDGAEKKDLFLSAFESAKGFIKRELARELGLRYMPDIQFFYDGSFDYGDQINRMLKSIQADDEFHTPPTGEK